jgi:5-formyltetrahydrofolate cyclo-ligase
MSPINHAKTQLREKLKALRSQFDPSLAETASLGVWNVLQHCAEYKKATGIGAFASLPGEINTYPLLEGVLKSEKKLYLPRVAKEKDHFEFYPVSDLKSLVPGLFGIREPTGPHPASWEELDLVLVPGLAFDHQGNRLGFGKGYYDRALPHLRKNALSVGLAFSFQILEKVPVESNDIPMKALLSERGFAYCEK